MQNLTRRQQKAVEKAVVGMIEIFVTVGLVLGTTVNWEQLLFS